VHFLSHQCALNIVSLCVHVPSMCTQDSLTLCTSPVHSVDLYNRVLYKSTEARFLKFLNSFHTSQSTVILCSLLILAFANIWPNIYILRDKESSMFSRLEYSCLLSLMLCFSYSYCCFVLYFSGLYHMWSFE